MGLIAPAREQGKTRGKRQIVSRHVLQRHPIAKSLGTGLGLLREVAAITQSPGKGEDDMKWIWRNRRNGTGYFGPRYPRYLRYPWHLWYPRYTRNQRYPRNYERDRAVATLRAALLFVFMSFVLAMLVSSAR